MTATTERPRQAHGGSRLDVRALVAFFALAYRVAARQGSALTQRAVGHSFSDCCPGFWHCRPGSVPAGGGAVVRRIQGGPGWLVLPATPGR